MTAPSSSNKTIIIFGATGAIGTTLIEIVTLKNPDWKVLAASRSGGKGSHLASMQLPNVTLLQANIEDLEDAKRVMTENNVDMVFSCIGFPKYEAKHWAEHWPIVVANLLEITSTVCPLVFCDNLYAYGATTNISSKTALVEPSLKTKFGVRAKLRKDYFEPRMKEAPQSITVVGGADFFGPRLDGKSFLADLFVGNIVKGDKPMALGSSSVKHDFCYTHDFSNALYTVATNPSKSMGRFWICPHNIQGKSLDEIAAIVHKLNGTTDKGISVLPKFMMSILGLFVGDLKNMKEMMPWWTKDYTVDDSEFLSTFQGVKATPMNDALQETIDYYKSKQ